MAVAYDQQRLIKKAEGYNPQAGYVQAVDRYLKEKFTTALTTKKSRQRYEVVIKRFRDFMGRYHVENVSEITRDMILDYLGARSEKIKGKTWNFERGVLYNFFKHCLTNDWAVRNPVERIPPRKLALPHINHLTAQEAQKLWAYLRGNPSSKTPYNEIIATILFTGMRVNEAVHLTKADVLLEKWLFIIQEKVINGEVWRPKTKARRFVPIPANIRPIIEKQLTTRGELLFPDFKGRLIRDRDILIKLKAVCKKAEVKQVHTHSLRHTFTSVTSEQGIPEVWIQEVLGHKSADMTRRYRHLRPEFLGNRFKDFDYGQGKDGKV